MKASRGKHNVQNISGTKCSLSSECNNNDDYVNIYIYIMYIMSPPGE